ncbi:ATP binding protein, putative [Theobroma cacao]|uniref:ATP binding protein, putative n=1 Tax=Theobroma cacao TaxID=3641 RepID=A0A061G233_THECC|nr:ATP binding protein, putative [Theobroma cacao]
METIADPSSDIPVNGLDSSIVPLNSDHDLLAELESVRESYHALQSKSSSMEENLGLLQHQRDEAISESTKLTGKVHELSLERDFLRHQIEEFEVTLKENEEEFAKKIDEESKAKLELEKELEVTGGRIEQLQSEMKVRNEVFAKNLDSIRSVKDNLVKLIEILNDEKEVIENFDSESEKLELEEEEMTIFSREITMVLKLASEANSKVNEYTEARKKEKRELENSVVSLTEENRDINSLLRVALVEKEAVEKSLNKLKGNNEQKRVALLQIAERGLQRVGFGFMMGSGSNEQALESSGASTTTASTTGSKSDSSECEEEVVSLASTVERIMKNLRLEISQLRRSLEESRSDTERLQSLTEKQAQKLEENTLYIRELEERERVLAQSAEELLMEIKETEAEVARWREACELEVEAGKKEVEERDKVVVILKQELEKTKAALEISNGKLKLKEELAAAAMAAQAAAERSLQLADSRAAGLRDRIEELTKQLEEAESKERSRRKVRHICWPWRALKMNITNNTNNRVQDVKRMLPEMQALLHHTM